MENEKKNSWQDHLQNETILERLNHNGCKVVFIEVRNRDYFLKYIYRMLAFQTSTKPVLILNLETSEALAPLFCLGKNEGLFHENLATISSKLSFYDFKEWALETLDKELINQTINSTESATLLIGKEQLLEALVCASNGAKDFSNKVFDLYSKTNQQQGSFITTIKILFGHKIDYSEIVNQTVELENVSRAFCDLLVKHENPIKECNDPQIFSYFSKLYKFAVSLHGFCRTFNIRQIASYSISKGENFAYSEFQKIDAALNIFESQCRRSFQDLIAFEAVLFLSNC